MHHRADEMKHDASQRDEHRDERQRALRTRVRWLEEECQKEKHGRCDEKRRPGSLEETQLWVIGESEVQTESDVQETGEEQIDVVRTELVPDDLVQLIDLRKILPHVEPGAEKSNDRSNTTREVNDTNESINCRA